MLRSRDKTLQQVKKALEGKLLIERNRVKQAVHQILWVSRSRYGEKPIRVGVMMADRTLPSWFDYSEFEEKFLKNDGCHLVQQPSLARSDSLAK